MARATKGEVQQRIALVAGLLADCMKLREIRAYVNAKTGWGPTVSDATLKYYMSKARASMKDSADFDFKEEFGIRRCRLERIMARAAAKGDLRTQLAADRQHGEMLGLDARHIEGEKVDPTAARAHLVEQVAQEIADHEDTNKGTTRPRAGTRGEAKGRGGGRPGR